MSINSEMHWHPDDCINTYQVSTISDFFLFSFWEHFALLCLIERDDN